ncbi:XdhC family protein [Rhizobium leguminosarum]|uniref:XdhC family protein n=1 Tax=Rhizobium leguminosarum TaxID=384 RepID=UPI00143F1664|nr:XdhC family protein [Rhizobium leguminosarum]NKL23929.1 XdhC family protein [Rhizobium leguminosarum bv. viciae]
MKLADLMLINEARKQRTKVVTITNLASGDQNVLFGQDAVNYEASALDLAAPRPEDSDDLGGQRDSNFTNVYLPNPRIVVIGAVHIAQALAALARITAFDVLVIDPRTAFAAPERFPDVDILPEWPEDALRMRGLDQFSALVALSHDPKIDDYAISLALEQGCFYVGALGSRKTHAKRLDRLANQGATEAQLQKIRGPIGLDIGAKSPAEIAIAILAEVISAWRRPDGTTS